MKLNSKSALKSTFICLGALLIVGILVWQAIVEHGNPDPTIQKLSPMAVAVSSGILVFREGLEAILVLATITAGAVRNKSSYWRSVLLGSLAGFAATVITWFIVVAIISAVNAPELAIQAATGLLAVIVLLVVMNWFFHKIYWTGWIAKHNKQKGKVLGELADSHVRVSYGLLLLGFTAIYREGFEVVLFLQDLRLKAGTPIVMTGATIGLILTLIVAALTFVAHQKLPYKKMLVLTGVMLGVVLVVMVGESVQEMQQAGWIGIQPIHLWIPNWAGTWFATFPNIEGLTAQALAASLVVGSYFWVRHSVPKSGSMTTT